VLSPVRCLGRGRQFGESPNFHYPDEYLECLDECHEYLVNPPNEYLEYLAGNLVEYLEYLEYLAGNLAEYLEYLGEYLEYLEYLDLEYLECLEYLELAPLSLVFVSASLGGLSPYFLLSRLVLALFLELFADLVRGPAHVLYLHRYLYWFLRE
jgi:hypothetical protein